MRVPKARHYPNRRTLLLSAPVAALAMTRKLRAAELRPHIASAEATLSISTQEKPRFLPRTLCGLSLETAALAEPGVLCPDNHELIALHRGIASKGILRLGGNTSDVSWWQAENGTPMPQMLHSPPSTHRHFFAITPEQLQNLKGFVDQTGWDVIWGLNLGTGTAEQAAVEAMAVTKILGKSLMAFQIGNEPDLFNRYGHAMRGENWSFPHYLNEWIHYARIILKSCPDAVFMGPDTAISDDWIKSFAYDVPEDLRPHLLGLSGHYYAEGPPDAPESTIAHLLSDSPVVQQRIDMLKTIEEKTHLPFFMTEGNSCYLGGKPGVSDSFAAALWATDYILRMAQNGCNSVCFHGGASEVEHANNEQSQGARNDAERKRAKNGAFYSPIAGTPTAGYQTRPLYYGIKAAAALAGTTLASCMLKGAGPELTAYAGHDVNGLTLILVNRSLSNDLRVNMIYDGKPAEFSKIQRLSAPSIDALDNTRLETVSGQVAGQTSIPKASALILKT